MKIIDLLNEDKVTLSFEVFPPKTSSKYENVLKAAEKIASLNPSFMSVTYGAGGGTSAHTVALAKDIHEKYDVEVMAHLTCVSSTREHVESMVEQFKENGIENIMALRGDIPKDGQVGEDYQYACQLIKELKEKGDFCIGAACYPGEGSGIVGCPGGSLQGSTLYRIRGKSTLYSGSLPEERRLLNLRSGQLCMSCR